MPSKIRHFSCTAFSHFSKSKFNLPAPLRDGVFCLFYRPLFGQDFLCTLHNFGRYFSTPTATRDFLRFNKNFTFARFFRCYTLVRHSRATHPALVGQRREGSNSVAAPRLDDGPDERTRPFSFFAGMCQMHSLAAEKSRSHPRMGKGARGKCFPAKRMSKRAPRAASASAGFPSPPPVAPRVFSSKSANLFPWYDIFVFYFYVVSHIA